MNMTTRSPATADWRLCVIDVALGVEYVSPPSSVELERWVKTVPDGEDGAAAGMSRVTFMAASAADQVTGRLPMRPYWESTSQYGKIDVLLPEFAESAAVMPAGPVVTVWPARPPYEQMARSLA